MLIGNTQAQNTIQTYLQAFLDGKHITPFLILQGPSGVGKMTMITQLLKEHLGQYWSTDSKVANNLSAILGKKHSFKVEVPTSDQYVVDKETGDTYDNPGSRDLRSRLARAPLGPLKVVIIEDIERMTISAANALLKEFEEPLPGRLIIGTVDEGKTILDTILSRAFLVKFHRVAESQMQGMIPQDMDSGLSSFLLRLSRGRPGVLQDLLGQSDEIQQLQGILSQTANYLQQGGSIVDQMKRLTEWKKLGRTYDTLLESLLGEEGLTQEEHLIESRRRLMSNVNEENVMWDVMLRR